MTSKNVNKKIGMSLILAGSMGVAMSLPIYAMAEDGNNDMSLTPREGEGNGNGGNTIDNLNDAQHNGFLPYDNEGNGNGGNGNGQGGDGQGNQNPDGGDGQGSQNPDGGDGQGNENPDGGNGNQNPDNGNGNGQGGENPNSGNGQSNQNPDNGDGQGGQDPNEDKPRPAPGVSMYFDEARGLLIQDDPYMEIPAYRDENGNIVKIADDNQGGGKKRGGDDTSSAPKVGDVVYDDDGNAYVITEVPDDLEDGTTITNLYDAQRLGFILVPEDEYENGSSGSGNGGGNNDPTPSTPDTTEVSVSITFVGDEGNEDKRPESVTVNIYEGGSRAYIEGFTVNKSDGYTATITVPTDGFLAIPYSVDYYSSDFFSGQKDGDGWGFTLTFTYTGEKIVDKSVEEDERQKQQKEQKEETPAEQPKEEKSEEKPATKEEVEKKDAPTAETPKKRTPSSNKDIVQTGVDLRLAPTIAFVSMIVAGIGLIFTKRMEAQIEE